MCIFAILFMATLTIEYTKSKYMPALPHKLFINGQLVGVMQQPVVRVELPRGEYRITIQSMIPLLSAERYVVVEDSVCNSLAFYDKEKWWDALFWVALVAEVVHCFVSLAPKWNVVYHVVDDGLFVAWLVYEWRIRKRYFVLDFWQSAKK